MCVEWENNRRVGREGQVWDEGFRIRPIEETEKIGEERIGKSPEKKRQIARLDSRSGNPDQSVFTRPNCVSSTDF